MCVVVVALIVVFVLCLYLYLCILSRLFPIIYLIYLFVSVQCTDRTALAFAEQVSKTRAHLGVRGHRA